MTPVAAVRVIVRDLSSGLYHRGVRIGDSVPVTFGCEVGILSIVKELPHDVRWKLVHSCLRPDLPGQTLDTRGTAP